jgi:hypothetical protein
MKLYQIYKEVNGKRVFSGRLAATDDESAADARPPLGQGEKYFDPVECNDADEYRAAVHEYEDKMAREHLPDRRGEIRIIINGLRDTLAAMNSDD